MRMIPESRYPGQWVCRCICSLAPQQGIDALRMTGTVLLEDQEALFYSGSQ